MAHPALEKFKSDFTAYNTRDAAAIEGISGDVTKMAELIKELQNSPGTLTPEDQAILDELTTLSGATTTKLEALDASQPPVVPQV